MNRAEWAERLPSIIEAAFTHWNLRPGSHTLHEAPTASWVSSVIWSEMPAILKIPFPHMEAADEARGLKYWDGDPIVRLLDTNDEIGAMLLEHVLPGNTLRECSEEYQDKVLVMLLRRLWQKSAEDASLTDFRHLSCMLEFWRNEALAVEIPTRDVGLAMEGFHVLDSLGKPAFTDVLLATDLHAGNVLQGREGWRIIDPKPFVGDRAYDLVQHILNCRSRLERDPVGLVERLAHMAQLDAERVRLWLFGRTAALSAASAHGPYWAAVARKVASRST